MWLIFTCMFIRVWLRFYPETIKVLASTGVQTDLSSFVELYNYTFTESGWYEVTVDLKDYVDQEVYLAVNYVSNDGWIA